MSRKGKIFISTIGLLCLIGYVGFSLKYYISIEEANKKGLENACRMNTEQEFKGRIIDINTFDFDSFMHGRFFNLRIMINDSTKEYVDYHYNLKPNKEILDFAKIGQTAIKMMGEDNYQLIDSTGEQRTFIIAKCARNE